MLITGTRLGPYEITGTLGSGGMGDVYGAHDARLNRTVAIKVLPKHLAERADSRERFEREAKAIAALNHPHICILYDTGVHEGTHYLVMERLDGDTLADRLARGPLPLAQALEAAIQIADALDKAHRRGVTHRDLKPGNIMLTRSGVKLLDFGLAKLSRDSAASTSQLLTTMPTALSRLTAEGTILGTLQYMSPEQLEGQEADARTDIFSFGAVLYEMITGKRAFEGKSQPSLIAAIMEHQPPAISSLQSMTPASLDRVVARCLEKHKEDRIQTARDVVRELKWIQDHGQSDSHGPAASTTLNRRRERIVMAVATVAVLAAIVVAAILFRRPVSNTTPMWTSIPAPVDQFTRLAPPVLSPDGTTLVFGARDASGKDYLWIRALVSQAARIIPETEGARDPFWSPDGGNIGFVKAGQLQKINLAGGSPQVLADAQNSRGRFMGPRRCHPLRSDLRRRHLPRSRFRRRNLEAEPARGPVGHDSDLPAFFAGRRAFPLHGIPRPGILDPHWFSRWSVHTAAEGGQPGKVRERISSVRSPERALCTAVR